MYCWFNRPTDRKPPCQILILSRSNMFDVDMFELKPSVGERRCTRLWRGLCCRAWTVGQASVRANTRASRMRTGVLSKFLGPGAIMPHVKKHSKTMPAFKVCACRSLVVAPKPPCINHPRILVASFCDDHVCCSHPEWLPYKNGQTHR